jgi:PAS domain S-box-containing protein/putative nucleotidyltransferase with HDIG domain
VDWRVDDALGRITRLASEFLRAPIAWITLTTTEGVERRGARGVGTEATEDRALVALLAGKEGLIVGDASQDPHLALHPLVARYPNVRFVAAVPLVTPEGGRLGALCVADPEPRPEDADTILATLADLAAIAVDELELRRKEQLAQRAAARVIETLESVTDAFYSLDHAWRFTYLNPRAEQLLKRSRQALVGKVLWNEFPETKGSLLEGEYRHAMLTMQSRHFEFFYPPLATTFEVRAYPSTSGLSIYFQDISEKKRAEEELRHREARFRALIEKSFECVTLVDRDWQIVYQSPSTTRVIGYAPHEHVGEVREDLLHPDDRESFAEILKRLKANPGASETVRYRFRHKDGRWRWLEANVTNMLEEPSVEAFVINYRDVSEQVEAQEAIRELNRKLRRSAESYRALANFGATIEEINDVETLMAEGLQNLSRQLGLEVATAYRIEADVCRLEQCWRERPSEVDRLLQAPLRKGEGALGQAAADGKLVYIEDYQIYADGLAAFRDAGLRTHLVLPVTIDGRVERLIALSSYRRTVKLGVEQLTIAANFVKRLKNALERIDHLNEIAATREATFRALGLALEYRDYETKGHTDRVADLALRFGRALGLDADALQAVQWGAYLHDLGKIAISDTILLKSGKLTENEFAIIKQHTLYGFEMCRDIPFLPKATRELIRSHHERYDGKGYPDGLAGEAIPLTARLFSLVDVYDALTSERPYKRAWTHEEAVAELERQRGAQFDPALVEVFLAVLAKTPAQAPQ